MQWTYVDGLYGQICTEDHIPSDIAYNPTVFQLIIQQ